MKGYSLDTNICIALLKGEHAVAERLRRCRASEIDVCSIVRAELYFGARKSEHVDRNLALLARFLAPFRATPFDPAAAETYGLVRTALERSGRPIGPNDLLIASLALAQGLTLVTRNEREFSRVPGLRVEAWA